jgi:hypothetical protein
MYGIASTATTTGTALLPVRGLALRLGAVIEYDGVKA